MDFSNKTYKIHTSTILKNTFPVWTLKMALILSLIHISIFSYGKCSLNLDLKRNLKVARIPRNNYAIVVVLESPLANDEILHMKNWRDFMAERNHLQTKIKSWDFQRKFLAFGH